MKRNCDCCREVRATLRLILVIVAAIAGGHGVDILDIIPGY